MKQRTDEERRAVVAAWQASGETAEIFCKQQGISYESLKRWRYRPGVSAVESFLPVALVPSAGASARSSSQVMISEQTRIECNEHTDEVTLAKAIRAAVAACGRI